MKEVRIIGSKEGKGENQFAQPRGVCINRASKELFIVDCNNHRIQVYHLLSLAYIRQIGKGLQGNAPGCLMYPVGICMDDANQIFVADTNNHRIVVFNHITGVFVRTIGSLGAARGCLNCPYGVCVDLSSGLLFVADYENNRVQVFDKDSGDFVRVIGKGLGTSPGMFNQPIDVCLDPDTGYLYVADYANNRVQVMTKEGQHIHCIAPHGSDAFSGPRSLCISREAGLLLVSDRENHRVQVYNKSTWELKRHIGHGMGAGPGQFNRPMDLCIDCEEGVLIAVDGYNHRVQIMEIDELQEERHRLQAIKQGKSEALVVHSNDVTPSHLAVTSTVAGIGNFGGCPKSFKLAQFVGLSAVFDMPIQSSHVDQVLNFAGSSEHRQSGPASAVAVASLPATNPSAAEMSVISQAHTFMTILEQLAGDSVSESTIFLASPSLQALSALLCRGWKPGRVSEQVVNMLIFLIQHVAVASIDVSEGNKLLEAAYILLKQWAIVDSSNRSFVVCAVFDTLKQQRGTYGDQFRSAGGAILPEMIYNRSVVLSLFDLLAVCIERSDETTFLRACGASNQIIQTQSGTGSASCGDSEISSLLYGTQLSNALYALHNKFVLMPMQRISNPARVPWNESVEGSPCLRFPIPELLCDLVGLALRFNTQVQSDEQFQATFMDQCAKYIATTSSDLNTSSIMNPKPKTRGGRNVWQSHCALSVGDLIDCMDKEKSWFESIVLECLPLGAVKVHFLGWGTKWDDVIAAADIGSRIAPLNTNTKNWRADLFEGGLIEVKCNDDIVNQKWMWGRISRLNVEESWVEVSYSFSNEPSVLKKAWLYGETICPVGMHTKDKSKAASSSIIRPLDTMDDILRDKLTNNTHCVEDSAFFDGDDDHIFQDGPWDKSQVCSVDNKLSDSKITAPSFAAVAIYVFQSVLRCLVMSIALQVQDRLLLSSVCEQRPFIGSCVNLIKVLLRSPWKKFVATDVVRPLYLHAGMHARALANNVSVAFHSTQNDWTLAFNLCEKLENVKMVYVAILTDIFGGSMHPSTLEFVKSRIGKTIDFCGFSSIACDMIVMLKHEKTFACIANMLRPLLSSDRFQVQNVQLRNIFRGIVGAVAPQQTQELLSLVETKFVFIRIRRALKGDWESIGDDPVKILNFMKVLIDNFVSVKDLLGKELFGDVRSKFAAERAVIAGSDRLRERDAQALGQLLASYLQGYTFVCSVVLEGGKQLSLPVVYGDAENLMHVVKHIVNEEVFHHLSQQYLRLLLERALTGQCAISNAERTLLQSLPCMGDILSAVNEFDAAMVVKKEFACYLLERIDSGKVVDAEVLRIAAKPDGVGITVIGSDPWCRFLTPGFHGPVRLPKALSIFVDEFELFLSRRHSLGRSTRLTWCHGHGRVTLSVVLNDQEIGEMELNEFQCVVMICLQDSPKRMADICLQTNMDLDLASDVVRSLTASNAQLVDLIQPMASLSFSDPSHTPLSMETIVSLRGDIVEVVRHRHCLRLNQSHRSHSTTRMWRKDIIDAGIFKTMKTVCRAERHYLQWSMPEIVGEVIKYLHNRHPHSLFSSTEITERFHNLVSSGLVDEIAHSPTSKQPYDHAPSRTYERGLPKSMPFNTKSTEKVGGVAMTLEKFWVALHDTISTPSGLFHASCRAETSDQNQPAEHAFVHGLLSWVGHRTWLLEQEGNIWTVQSVPATFSQQNVALKLACEGASGFDHWLQLMTMDLVKSSAFAAGCLVKQLNLLLHQFNVCMRGLDSAHPVHSIDDFLSQLEHAIGVEPSSLEQILLCRLFFAQDSLVVKEYCRIFRDCISVDDHCSVARTLDAVFEGVVSSDQSDVLWAHKFEVRSEVVLGNYSHRKLYSLLILVSGIDIAVEDCGEVSEGKDADCFTTEASENRCPPRTVSLGEFVQMVLNSNWMSRTAAKHISNPNEKLSYVEPPLSIFEFENCSSGGNTPAPGRLRSDERDVGGQHTRRRFFSHLPSDDTDHSNIGREMELPATQIFMPTVDEVDDPFSPLSFHGNLKCSEQKAARPRGVPLFSLHSLDRRVDRRERCSVQAAGGSATSSSSSPDGSQPGFSVSEFAHLSTGQIMGNAQGELPNWSNFIQPAGIAREMPSQSLFTPCPIEAQVSSLYCLLQSIDEGVKEGLLRGLGQSTSPGTNVQIPDQMALVSLDYAFQAVMLVASSHKPNWSQRLLWWCNNADLNTHGILAAAHSALSAVRRDACSTTHRDHLSKWTMDTIVSPESIKDQYFLCLLRSLEEVANLHWSKCCGLLQVANFSLDAFFDLAFSASCPQRRPSFFQLSLLPNLAVDCRRVCRHCCQAQPLLSHYSLSCGHFSCTDCWRKHIKSAICTGSFKPVSCIDANQAAGGQSCSNNCVEVDASFIQHLLGDECTKSYLRVLLNHYQEIHSKRSASTISLQTGTALSVISSNSFVCNLCRTCGNSCVDHQSVMRRSQEKLAIVERKMLLTDDSMRFEQLLGHKRFWGLTLECCCLAEHLSGLKRPEGDTVVRMRTIVDQLIFANESETHCVDNANATLCRIKKCLSDVYVQHRVVKLTGKYTLPNEYHEHVLGSSAAVAPFAFAEQNFCLVFRMSSSDGKGVRSSKQSVVQMIDGQCSALTDYQQPCARLTLLTTICNQLQHTTDHQLVINIEARWNQLSRLWDDLDAINAAAEMKLLCQIGTNLCAALHRQNVEELFLPANWTKLRQCLRSLTDVSAELLPLLKFMMSVLSFNVNVSGHAQDIQRCGLRQELVALLSSRIWSSEMSLAFASVLARCTLIFSTNWPLQHDMIGELSAALHSAFTLFDDPSSANEKWLFAADALLIEIVERMSCPDVNRFLTEDWKRSLLPIQALRRLLNLLQRYTASSKSKSSQVHSVCAAMMTLSGAFNQHCATLHFGEVIVQTLRRTDTSDSNHLLLVCSALGKLIMSLCMRETAVRDALKTSSVVQALKEKKQQVISISTSQGESYDIKSRCNMSAFTITTAIQGILTGYRPDLQRYDPMLMPEGR